MAPVSDLQVTMHVAQHTGPLTSGGLTNDATPALSGTAEAGSTVTIYDGSTVLGTAVADEDGHWRFTPDPLARGAPPQHHGDRCGGEHQRPLAGLCCSRWTPPVAPVSDLQVTDDVAAAHRAADQRRADQ
ncbi:hypothetical protein LAD78_16670 [Klebsiella pneumoniae]|uniref:Ig-like domain-containing protein n=1 Tax=Klebsiella pneumoniae TaxID=573 RepID=UPI00226F1EDB|nr:Ig-like domain-containing protein [Klebsiella pneumoniae]MCX9999291.1 hypothetical protein [Klebsiella pneumoniae]